MQEFMPVRPLDATSGACGPRGEIPVKIVAADSGKKYKSQKPSRRRRTKQQAACLPNHYDGANGYIQAAEYKKVDNFSEHSVSVVIMEESAQGLRMMICGEPMVSLDTLPVVRTKNLKVNESFWPAVSER